MFFRQMSRTLANYRNGNYRVMLLEDGTKIRYGDDDTKFEADFPESIDLNITDWCDIGCSFCYRGCTEQGKHFRFDEKYLDSLGFKEGMEIALGGGSPIRNPDLDKFCGYFVDRGCFPSITVHWSSMAIVRGGDLEHLQRLQDDGLLFGVGVSKSDYDATTTRAMKYFLKNAVAHVIAGVTTADDVYRYYINGVPVLILGYKNAGRGKIESPEEGVDLWSEIYGLRDLVHGILDGGGVPDFESKWGPVHDGVKPVISFDNLALDQLELKSVLPEERWNEVYMGDDGIHGELTSASMYMDLVSGTYALNSIDAKSHEIKPGDTISSMFSNLKKIA